MSGETPMTVTREHGYRMEHGSSEDMLRQLDRLIWQITSNFSVNEEVYHVEDTNEVEEGCDCAECSVCAPVEVKETEFTVDIIAEESDESVAMEFAGLPAKIIQPPLPAFNEISPREYLLEDSAKFCTKNARCISPDGHKGGCVIA